MMPALSHEFSINAAQSSLILSVATAMLSLGRIDWWLEAPWIGVASACSLVLIMAGLAIEHNRTNPLLMTRWLGSGVMIRLALAVVLIRMVLSEQSTGAVGFMQMLNMSYQQMHTPSGFSLGEIGRAHV